MKRYLQTGPLFLLLLPVFFLLHLLTDYFRVLYFSHLHIPETYWYLGAGLILFLFFSSKKPLIRRLALFAFLLEFIFFFFGPIHGFLEENAGFLGKYTVMLASLFVLCVVAAFLLIRSHKPFYNTFQYLNIVLLTLVGYEIVLVTLLYATDGRIKRLTKNYPISDSFKQCDTCVNPDIYFLVFDMYANSKVLKSFWNYDNHELDSFLDSTGFYYARNSTSNYNYTVFSIGSTMNMDYQEKDLKYTNAFRSSRQLSQFEDNELFRILKKQGYQFYNYSWFHFNDAPTRVAPFVLTEPKELIAAQTFWFRFKSDIAWNFSMFRKKKPAGSGLTPFFIQECEDNLSRIRVSHKGIKEVASVSNNKPVFLYAHFLMPHAPFLFDSVGNVKPQLDWLSTKHEDYLSQLKYTNKVIIDLCNTILKENTRPKIIIVQSDHGYRNYNSKDKLSSAVEFENLNAFYFSDKRYSSLYDSISAVNTFRVILNNYFNYSLPLLKDTSFYMRLR